MLELCLTLFKLYQTLFKRYLISFGGYFIPSNGATEQAFGARIRMHDVRVGAMRSTLTGVVIFSGLMLYPYRNIGKFTYASLQ